MRNTRARLMRLEAGAGGRPERAVAQACTLLTDEELETLSDLFDRPGLPWEVDRDELLEHARSETEVQAVERFCYLLQTAS